MGELCAKRLWLEEDIGDNCRVAYRVTQVLLSGKSEFQAIDLVDTPTWGKVLLLDGDLQSTEADEGFYHELLVHPALLHHANPKSVFIMGGGEGASAREVLRHKSVQQVVMVDIDKVVTDFCSQHMERNKAAFKDPRLTLINDDARTQLEQWQGKFDVIIGDLVDPVDGGPSYQLYTQEFYKDVVLEKLNPGGIFVTQSGACSFLSCTKTFTAIYKTLASVFPKLVPFNQHIPSYFDTWGFNMAFKDGSQQVLTAQEFDERAEERIEGQLIHVDGKTFLGRTRLNKTIRTAIANETEIYTKDNARFIHGAGVKS